MSDNYIWTGDAYVAARDVYAIRAAVKGSEVGGGWQPRVALVTAHQTFEVQVADQRADRASAEGLAGTSALALADLLSTGQPGVARCDDDGRGWHLVRA